MPDMEETLAQNGGIRPGAFNHPPRIKTRRTITCLCGSTRFKEEFIAANRRETLAGNIVLSVGMFGHDEGIDMAGPIKAGLDDLHLDKIDLADEILVLNPPARVCPSCKTVWRHDAIRVSKCSCGAEIGDVEPVGYIGQSTAREIAYARHNGKRVRYLTSPSSPAGPKPEPETVLDLFGVDPILVPTIHHLVASGPFSVAGQNGREVAHRTAVRLTHDLGLGRDLAIRVMLAWNRRCSPPWSQGEIVAQVDHVFSRSDRL